MAKSQSHELRKPAMTLKERRAAKREKLAHEFIPQRKRPSR